MFMTYEKIKEEQVKAASNISKLVGKVTVKLLVDGELNFEA